MRGAKRRLHHQHRACPPPPAGRHPYSRRRRCWRSIWSPSSSPEGTNLPMQSTEIVPRIGSSRSAAVPPSLCPRAGATLFAASPVPTRTPPARLRLPPTATLHLRTAPHGWFNGSGRRPTRASPADLVTGAARLRGHLQVSVKPIPRRGRCDGRHLIPSRDDRLASAGPTTRARFHLSFGNTWSGFQLFGLPTIDLWIQNTATTAKHRGATPEASYA